MSEARGGTFRRRQQVSDQALRENVELRTRVAELSTALAELIMTVGRHAAGMSMAQAAPLSVAVHKATLAWTPKENAVALEVDPEPPSRVVGEHDPSGVRND